MLNNLIESKAKKQRSVGATITSVVINGSLALLAVYATANAAVEAAIKLAKKESLTGSQPFMNDNIKKEVPAILLEVQTVDKNNLMTTVIKDGFAKYEDVYANVPADQRPPKQ